MLHQFSFLDDVPFGISAQSIKLQSAM